MKNSQYTREFRDSCIQLALNSNKEIKHLAVDLGINSKTLYNWVYNYKREHSHSSTKSSTNKESLDDELIRLRKENRLLKQERDILKKATAYFAKETL